jgi:hypothetical protein
MEFMDFKKVKSSPVFFGIISGILAVSIQLLLSDDAPLSYGICTVCHTRDFMHWIINLFAQFDMDQPAFVNNVFILTPVGLVIGSFIAAKSNNEYNIQRLANPVPLMIYGFIVAVSGLIIMSCPTRIILRSSFGDSLGLLAALGLCGGIATAVRIMKRIS